MPHHITDTDDFRQRQTLSSRVDPLDPNPLESGLSLSKVGIENIRRRYEFARRFVPSDAIVGDFGCSSGYGSYLLRGAYRQYMGFDLPEVIEQVISRGRYTGDGIRFVGTDFNSDHINFDRIDFAIAMEVLEHLFEPERFLSAVNTALPTNGTLVISTPNNPSNDPQFITHFKEYSLAEVKGLLEGAKFIVDGMYSMGVPVGLVLRILKGYGIRVMRKSREEERSGASKILDHVPPLRALYNQIYSYGFLGSTGATILAVAHKS